MNRRELLHSLPLLSAAASAPAAQSSDFTFVFYTDVHVQPELRAAEGTARAFARINGLKADFCISGGDQVFDVCEQDLKRARTLFDLYLRLEKELNCPVHRVIGNHDVTGINQASPFEPGDIYYGKRLYEDYLGKRYYSFDHKGWRFIVLDSIGIEPRKVFVGEYQDEEQLDWLRRDLTQVHPATPIVLCTHVPMVTAIPFTSLRPPEASMHLITRNGAAVRQLLSRHNLKLVLQGHTHVWEKIEFRGAQYVTGGAVSGAWWKGPTRAAREGYTICRVSGGEVTVTYASYPWNAATA